RRGLLKDATATLGASFWAESTLEAALQNTRTASKPADLKITDLRIANLAGLPMRVSIIRIDTNQGLVGYGEVRDGASRNYALMLKRILIGENPCNVDRVFRKIKQFGFHARQAGGVCGVEMALWDLAGKAYNVPVYAMLGGRFRDTVRVYADTPMSRDPAVYAERLKKRIADGFTWLKMDVGIDVLRNTPGTISAPLGAPGLSQGDRTVHMLTGIEVTDKGIALMGEKVAQVRDAVGMDVPLGLDHFGHIGVNSCIRIGKAFQKYNPAWMEDFIPWQYTDLWKEITKAIDVPTLTGEDIYLKEPFELLCREHAVDIIQPDLATSGGILETHKIGDMAQSYGVPMVMHMAGSPVSYFANVHCAAATDNFLVLENHSVDQPDWADIVDGVEKPIVNRGFTKVPEGPGLGFTINEEALKKQVRDGYFEPSNQWDTNERINDRLWS
ncbi:MAG: mandelate racemase/muconate lactonizing enzyme family protein, partial [Nitrospira sp.]